jgi:hypothetical protein
MKDTTYFSHDSDARNDLKCKALIKKYGMEGYGMYWVVIELMRSQEGYKLPKKEYVYQGICDEIGKDIQFVKQFLDDCSNIFELFISNGEYFFSQSLLDRMKKKDEKSEKNRKAGYASAEARGYTSAETRKKQGLSTVNEQVVNNPEASVEHDLTTVEQPLNTGSAIKKETKEEKLTLKLKALEEKKKDLEKRRAEFEQRVFEHDPLKYDNTMLTAFCNYWSECGKDLKMRYEFEKVFEIGRRLATWANREKERFTKPQYHATDY